MTSPLSELPSESLPTMTSRPALTQQATHFLIQGSYAQASALYEELLEMAPDERQHAWYLGLTYLLQGDETAAQMTWTLAMAEAEEENLSAWVAELLEILEAEVQRQVDQSNLKMAWVIRQHIRQVDPTHLNNLLHSLWLATQLEEISLEQLLERVVECDIQTAIDSADDATKLNPDLLLPVIELLLERGAEYVAVYDFVKATSVCAADTDSVISIILNRASHIGYVQRNYVLASRYGELCLALNEDHTNTLAILASLYVFLGKYDESIRLSKRFYGFCQTLEEKAAGSASVLRSLMRAGGNWEESRHWLSIHRQAAANWLNAYESGVDRSGNITRLFSSFFYLPYFTDTPRETRSLINQLGHLSQIHAEVDTQQIHGEHYQAPDFSHRFRHRGTRPLRIAYMSCFLRRHSVGWLARWLLHHHDRERFEVQVYFTEQSEVCEFGKKWYADKASKAACFYGDPLMMAQTIYDNEVDILVDLDSLTVETACKVLLLKPAPIQTTWLGWDAAGLPTVDYYIADNYVLPEHAQDYYTEKIWRLPTTYLAVDGFEVGVPTIRRDTLDIPTDAVIYFSSQTGQKRNPDNVRSQLKILNQVPNSYFLIKGFADTAQVQTLFEQLAAEEGVAFDRLRFLPSTPDEETHRANLAIADVVLDTFPYNGATTTMETLWMGIPLVTRVGQQFAARNSYGMMMNAGIQEGIAWSDQEYIDWGIRLGTDPQLRQQISLRLKQSRQTAPLWNAKQFTRDMEAAFEQMWQDYSQQD